jgi:hypothetical protein
VHQAKAEPKTSPHRWLCSLAIWQQKHWSPRLGQVSQSRDPRFPMK